MWRVLVADGVEGCVVGQFTAVDTRTEEGTRPPRCGWCVLGFCARRLGVGMVLTSVLCLPTDGTFWMAFEDCIKYGAAVLCAVLAV